MCSDHRKLKCFTDGLYLHDLYIIYTELCQKPSLVYNSHNWAHCPTEAALQLHLAIFILVKLNPLMATIETRDVYYLILILPLTGWTGNILTSTVPAISSIASIFGTPMVFPNNKQWSILIIFLYNNPNIVYNLSSSFNPTIRLVKEMGWNTLMGDFNTSKTMTCPIKNSLWSHYLVCGLPS